VSIADPSDSHDKAGKHVEARMFLTAPLEEDGKSRVNYIFLEIPSDMIGVEAHMSLPLLR